MDLWSKLNEEQKDALKLSSLEALGSSDLAVVRAAGSAIAAMCVLEIPEGKWLNVIEILCTNSSNEDRSIKVASLLTLGYICEELLPKELGKEHSDYILTALLDSLVENYQDAELVKESIQGVYHALKFTVEHFKSNQGKLIVDKVIGATNYPNVQVREIGMQCIVEIVRLSYDYIGEFVNDIKDATFNATDKDETSVKTQALEVWSSIAEEEHTRNLKNKGHSNIINHVFEELEKMLESTIEELNIGNEEIDEEQEWGTSVAAGCCLSLVAQVVQNRIIDPVTNYAAANIQPKCQWQQRY